MINILIGAGTIAVIIFVIAIFSHGIAEHIISNDKDEQKNV